MDDNENMMAMLQSYSKFYNEQIKELENNLISFKVDLANKLSLLDEYQNNLNKLKKKLISILKNHQISFETKISKKIIKKNTKKPSSMVYIPESYKKIPLERKFSFDFKNESQKESIFYYKMALVELAQKTNFKIKENGIYKNIADKKNIGKFKELKSRSKTIAVIINNFNRSPSILLKPQRNFTDLTDIKGSPMTQDIWMKNIIPQIKSKQNRDKTIKDIQNMLKKSFIPSKLRGSVWLFVNLFFRDNHKYF